MKKTKKLLIGLLLAAAIFTFCLPSDTLAASKNTCNISGCTIKRAHTHKRCSRTDCTKTSVHKHNKKYYRGHSKKDGHHHKSNHRRHH